MGILDDAAHRVIQTVRIKEASLGGSPRGAAAFCIKSGKVCQVQNLPLLDQRLAHSVPDAPALAEEQ